MKVWLAIFYKTQEWHACPAVHRKLAIGCLVFELSKLKFKAHNLFDGLLKGFNKMHSRWSRGVMGATPEGLGYHILQIVKMTLNARINMF